MERREEESWREEKEEDRPSAAGSWASMVGEFCEKVRPLVMPRRLPASGKRSGCGSTTWTAASAKGYMAL